MPSVDGDSRPATIGAGSSSRGAAREEAAGREFAFGHAYTPSWMDRAGIYLSERFVEQHVGAFAGRRLADIGCGHDARLVRRVLPQLRSATLVDVSLADDLKRDARVHALEGRLPEALEGLPAASLDVVLCINVLEHLWEPEAVVAHTARLLAPGGVALFNVPSWSGKLVLETAAFKLGLTVPEEIDDHKAYYDPRELWRLLVRGGYKPSQIRCGRHKFGLNVFGVARRPSKAR